MSQALGTKSGADIDNQVLLDKRDLFDAVRSAIRDAVIDTGYRQDGVELFELSTDRANNALKALVTAGAVLPTASEQQVHRYQVVMMLSGAGNKIDYKPYGPWVVMADVHDMQIFRMQANIRAQKRCIASLRNELTESYRIDTEQPVDSLVPPVSRAPAIFGYWCSPKLASEHGVFHREIPAETREYCDVVELVDRTYTSRLQAEVSALQQRLTIADQRVDDLESELTKAREVSSIAADDLHQANVRAILAEEQLAQSQCKHEWIDDGDFNLACTVCGAQENHDPQWRDMDSAPKDGTMLRLLVEFEEHSTEDAEQAPTIGSNNFENDEEDHWTFAGWCWTHDHWVQGKGKPVGWLPMFDGSQSAPAAKREAESRTIELSGCKFTEHELIARAVRAATGTSRRGVERWIAMKDAFGCGSGVANALCRRFGFDPGEKVKP